MFKAVRNILILFFALLVFELVCAKIVFARDAITIEDLPIAVHSSPVVVESVNTVRNTDIVASPAKVAKRHIASLSFGWTTSVNLGAFERNGKLWLIFDHPQQIDIEALKQTAGNLAENILQFPHPLGTIIQVTPAEGVKSSIRKEGLLWILDLYTGEIPHRDFKELTIFTQYDSLKQPYLYIPTTGSGNVISIIDPEIGDIISIAPSSQPNIGINHAYHYPEFDILNTLQGLAFVINAPDIMLTRGNSGLTLRAQGRSLNITGDLDLLKRRQQSKEQAAEDNFFDLQIPQKLISSKFVDVVDQLKKNIITAPISEKNLLRIELAKFYLYNGLGSNALYILNQFKKNKLEEANTERFHALSGIANFLARRYPEAVEDFSYGKLPEQNEGIFWRTLAQSAYEYKEPNNAIIFAHISLIRDYPQPIKDQIALVAAENSIKSGDDLSTQNFIDILRSVPDRMRNLNPEINYLAAQKLEMQGYPRNAIKEYRNIIHSASAKYSALARYKNAVLSQSIKSMPLKNAISELEMLRFAWTEARFKLQLLNKLSDLYLKDFDYYNSLRVLSEAVDFAKTEEQKKFIADKMVRVFEDIFLSNQADDKLSPVKALALYKDFNWLADMSSRKNAIIQRLADRLVAVDLVERAADLLNTLLNSANLSVENRARIGARLAIINLFNQHPAQAIEILKKTYSENLSPETSNPRRVIRARALSEIGKTDDALALLADDYSRTALLHKFKLYWDGGRWADAADTVKYLIEEPTPGKPLSTEQINYILDWATTLKKAGKETVLVRLRNKFLPYFANTQYHSIFNILTNQLEKDKVDIKEINSIVNDVETFAGYAKLYQESLQNNNID